MAISACSSWDIGISAAPVMGIMQKFPIRTWAAKPMLTSIFIRMDKFILRVSTDETMNFELHTI